MEESVGVKRCFCAVHKAAFHPTISCSAPEAIMQIKPAELWNVGSLSLFCDSTAIFINAFISPTTPRKKAAPEPMLPFA
ncbi:MAG: hypothetical protein AB7V36_09850 [Bacteroidales bacterium]